MDRRLNRSASPTTDSSRGLAYGASAYLLWGAFPLYWPLLEPATPVEALAHRVLWSALTIGLLVVLGRRVPQLRAMWRDRRVMALLLVAAVTISFNWGAFILGVNTGRVVEVSLGYFINPLVTVLMGVLVLGERLRAAQWGALALAAVAVLVLTVDYGHPPWVALTLAGSFACYGLAKKKAGAPPLESLATETLVLAPVVVVYLAWLVATGASTFAVNGSGHAVLMTTTGIVTAIPLLLFGAAANRISLVAIGLLQYIAPTVQFLLGVLWFGEPMPATRWIGFALVWVALVVFTTSAVLHRRRQLRWAAEASAL